jgi:hypothetical protein
MEYQIGDRVKCVVHLMPTDEWPSYGDHGTIINIINNKHTSGKQFYDVRWDTCKNHMPLYWGSHHEIELIPKPKTNREALSMLRR